jgi:hypothetical protein
MSSYDYDLNEIQNQILDSDYELIPQNIQITEEQDQNLLSSELLGVIAEDDSKKVNFNKKYNSIESKKKIQKYGNDIIYEAWADNKIFFPIADKFIDPLHEIGFTPNHVTYLGTFCTLLAVYYVYIDEHNYAVLAYVLGYLLDCVDGRLARKYNLTSQEGMILDLTTDYGSNLLLMMVIVHKHGYGHWFVLTILIMTILLGLSYGLNEAIICYKETGSDNFMERRSKQIGNTNNILDNLFLLINGMAYSSYRNFFPSWDEDKINNWVPIIKEFGPGNYTLIITYILIILPKAIN